MFAALYIFSAVIFLGRALFALSGRIGGSDLFDDGAAHTLLAMFAMLFVVLRTMMMMLMAGESSHRDLSRLAKEDPLTGALNRYGLALTHASWKFSSVTALVIDMDHFKTVNDMHGHAIGDELLICLVGIIKSNLTGCDVVARLGGDEFVVLLSDITEADGVRIAEAIRNDFAKATAARHLHLADTQYRCRATTDWSRSSAVAAKWRCCTLPLESCRT